VHKAMDIIGHEGRGVVVLIRESKPNAISSSLKRDEKPEQTGPLANETQAPPTCSVLIALHRSRGSVKPAR